MSTGAQRSVTRERVTRGGDPFGVLVESIVVQAKFDARRCPAAQAWLDQLAADILDDAPPHLYRRLTRDRELL